MRLAVPAPAWRPGDRLPALDAVRGLAILLVLVFHLTRGTGVPTLQAVARGGWAGVDLFFVLSGFLITGVLLDSRDRPGRWRHFYSRRARRIFPVYYGTLAALLFVVPLLGARAAAASAGLSSDAWWHWTYLSNWLWLPGLERATVPTAAHFWTLAIEEQFYLVWPLVVWRTPAGALSRVCLALAIAALLLRVTLLAEGVGPDVVYHLTVTRLDALALGGLLACWLRDPAMCAVLRRRLRPLAIGAATSAFLVIGSAAGWRYAPIMAGPGYTVLAIAAMALVAVVVLAPEALVPRVLARARWLQRLGVVSYGLYVYHLVVQGLLETHGWAPDPWAAAWGAPVVAQLAYYVVAGGLSVAVATASWHWLERRLLRAPATAPAAIAITL